MEKILFINACIRKESRTLVLAKEVLGKLEGEVSEIALGKEDIAPLTHETLSLREELTKKGEFDNPIFDHAKRFAEADVIVVAAPFWDLSFPSLLKIYIENISVAGVTFEYRKGRPFGLCRAKKLIYITTAGGKIIYDFGYSYVKALALNFYGIEKTQAYRAENLDTFADDVKDPLSVAEITIVD